jgi:hypothetical protein
VWKPHRHVSDGVPVLPLLLLLVLLFISSHLDSNRFG